MKAFPQASAIGIIQSGNVTADQQAAIRAQLDAVKKLIEQDKVQILLSPLSGDEGIAVVAFGAFLVLERLAGESHVGQRARVVRP